VVALPLSPACARAIAGGREDAPGLAAIAFAACGGRHSGDAGPGPTDSKWWSLTVPPFPPTNGYKGDTSPG
jgi:hypothetical protein